MKARSLIGVLGIFMNSCAIHPLQQPSPFDPSHREMRYATVLVRNDNLDKIRVYSKNHKLGTVQPLSEGCFKIYNPESPNYIGFRTINKFYRTRDFLPANSDGAWIVKLEKQPIAPDVIFINPWSRCKELK